MTDDKTHYDPPYQLDERDRARLLKQLDIATWRASQIVGRLQRLAAEDEATVIEPLTVAEELVEKLREVAEKVEQDGTEPFREGDV